MKKTISVLAIICLLWIQAGFTKEEKAKEGFNGLDMNLGNLSRLSNAESRSISPENFTGEKGQRRHGHRRYRKRLCPRPGAGLEGYRLRLILNPKKP